MRYLLVTAVTVLFYVLAPWTTAMASDFDERTSGMAEITDVRVSTGDGKLRVVLDADKPVTIKKMVLSNPDRLVVDIKGAWVSSKSKRNGPIDSEFANQLRVAQFDKNTVRVVIEMKREGQPHHVFTIEGGRAPGRVVLDVGNVDGGSSAVEPPEEKVEQELSPEDDPVVREASENFPSSEKESENESETGYSGRSTDAEIAALTGLKGKDITIDPGHGGSDSGAIGPTGVTEKSVTLRIALELEKILKEEGATVHMTRTRDTEVSPKGAHATDAEELQARCDIANRAKSDIFISIHMDSFTSQTARGTTGYYYSKGSRKSRELADKIRANLVDQLGTQSRGTQTCNFYVVRHTDMPATLIEVAFISYPEEEKLLNSKEGIRKAAMAIADGIADYFG